MFFSSKKAGHIALSFLVKWDAEVMNRYDEEGAWVYDLYDERGEFVTEFISYDSMRLYITEPVSQGIRSECAHHPTL